MIIKMTPRIFGILETISTQTEGGEFSGFGFCKVENEELEIYDFELMAWGDWAYTEIDVQKVYDLSQREDACNMRVWVHKHPMGSEIPGPHNWSKTDNDTINETPMGTEPSLISWCAAIVRTPRGWVGRIDTFKDKRQVHHVPVEVDIPEGLFDQIDALEAEWYKANQQSFFQDYGWYGRAYTGYPVIQKNQKGVEKDIDLDDEQEWLDYSDLLDRYIGGGMLTPEEKERLAKAAGATHTPDMIDIAALEDAIDIGDEIAEDGWKEMAAYWAIVDPSWLDDVIEDQYEDQEMDELYYRFRTGGRVTQEERDHLEAFIGKAEYDDLFAERLASMDYTAWEHTPREPIEAAIEPQTTMGWVSRVLRR